MEVTSKIKKVGYIINLYSEAGVGKTTILAKAVEESDNGLFVSIVEDGLSPLQQGKGEYAIGAIPRVEDAIDRWSELKKLPKFIEENGYTTVALDSLSAIVPALREYCFQKFYVQNPSAHGKGKTEVELRVKANGFGGSEIIGFMAEEFNLFIRDLNNLRGKGINFMISSHSSLKKQRDVGEELEYDVMSLDFPRSKAYSLDKTIIELSDATLYGKYDHTVFKTGSGKKGVVGGSGDRVFQTEATPAIIAKNRFNMPFEVGVNYIEVMSYIKGEK